MNHVTFAGNLKEEYQVALLIKEKYFKPDKIKEYYVDPLVKSGVPLESLIAFDLDYPNDKVTATQAKKYLSYLLPALVKLGITTVFVADAAYFKVLTGQRKAEQHTGYILPCSIKGFTHLSICYGLNYGVLLHNPNQIHKIDMAIDTLANHINGTLVPLGEDVLLDPQYYQNTDLEAFQLALDGLHNKPTITCDVETYGLRLDEGGLGSIAFSWNERSGLSAHIKHRAYDSSKFHELIKKFFEKYKGKVIYHNATFDIKQIIFNCFMKHPLDYRGMLHGLDVMCRNIHDTKIIAYLATNTTAGNELGLKVLAQPYMGNWGIDVNDISKIPVDELLTYNLEDCVATYYVFNVYYPMMLKDDQLGIYEEIMLPSIKLIVQMELMGMPIDMDQVKETETYLTDLSYQNLDIVLDSKYTKDAIHIIRVKALADINSKLKTKVHGMDKVEYMVFNPSSPNQLQVLLYEVLQLPEIDFTPTKNPATGAKTIAKLINHTKDEEIKELLEALINLSQVDKILGTFIPAFKESFKKANGHYLHGSFNLGGTLSGRLSSSNPNMQNLPSGSTHGKKIKECFKPPSGYLFVGADFSSLNLGEQYRNVLC
jgi:DNA polymerase-1